VVSSISISSCEEGGIINQGGALGCTTPNKGVNMPDVPEGNYLLSCNGCEIDDQRDLSCTCQSGDGTWKKSTLNANNCVKITNLDGILACEESAGQPTQDSTDNANKDSSDNNNNNNEAAIDPAVEHIHDHAEL